MTKIWVSEWRAALQQHMWAVTSSDGDLFNQTSESRLIMCILFTLCALNELLLMFVGSFMTWMNQTTVNVLQTC